MKGKIKCEICGEEVHHVGRHLQEVGHTNDDFEIITLDDYREEYPEAPTQSSMFIEAMKRATTKKKKSTDEEEEMTIAMKTPIPAGKGALDKIFSITEKEAFNSKGGPIMINILDRADACDVEMIPEKDPYFVFDAELVKTTLFGFEMNIPVYLWGNHGTGKSSIIDQIAAHTNREIIRVQHTGNTEESHILGQTHANATETYFEPGPLPLAMRNGWVYNADEYDYADPSVLAVYQSVLEGKPLLIKEAKDEWRHVKPHPNFRFAATGNTNGQGDETGQYIGTSVGNAANYSRFGITKHVQYMKPEHEVEILMKKSKEILKVGGISKADAKLFVKFAEMIRAGKDSGDMGSSISPRELIFATVLGLRFASFITGLKLAFINRLTEVDRVKASEMASRIFEEE